jgi:hypothetical protein
MVRKMESKKSIRIIMAVTLIAGIGFAPSASAATKPTAVQKAQLQYIVEEEKLARDVYAYLATNVTAQKFSNITRSEQVHMDQIAAILKTNKYWNPTLTRAPGVFYNSTLQALYNKLIAQGSVDYASAMGVGVAIEELDISDLAKMMGVDMPADMKLALDNLMRGSVNHLAAFRR